MDQLSLITQVNPHPIGYEKTALRAFEKWTARGRPADSHVLDWLEAEAEFHYLQELNRKFAELEERFSSQLAEQKRATHLLAVEHEIARVLMVSATLEEATSRILQCICESLGWDMGAMWLVDRQANKLRLAELWHVPTLKLHAFLQATREWMLALGEGLPGQVWASQAPILIPNGTQNGRLPRGPSAASEELHGAIAFPIANGVGFLGALEFFSRDMRKPDEGVTAMMSSIGGQISQFIERCHAQAMVQQNKEERRVASCIQRRLLPIWMPDFPGFQISGRCLSADDIGGDCFDFFPLPVDCCSSTGVLVADASGHGLGAALLATETRAYVRALALTCADVGNLLTLVNRRLVDDMESEKFVTAFLLRLESGGALAYANAGHWPGQVFDKHGKVRLELGSTGFPLGIDLASEFRLQSEIVLHAGELVLLYTDGVVESCSPSGKLFGLQRLLDIVQSHIHEPTGDILDEVFRSIDGFCENHVPQDDITVVLIKAE